MPITPKAHDLLRLYVSYEGFMIEPAYLDASVLSENLLINRESGIIRRNVPALPTVAREVVMSIYGIFGFIRLYSGEYLIVITNRSKIGVVNGADVWKMTGVKLFPFARNMNHLSDQQIAKEEEHLNAITGVLTSDNYYFSYSQDLTRYQQARRYFDEPLWKATDERFYFNRHLQRKLIDVTMKDSEQDLSAFILPVVSGFMEIQEAQMGSTKFQFAILSRRSVGRLGTRYFSRGIDQSANVSNFVETEQLLVFEDQVFSHCQIRGSIPLYWRQVVNARYKPRLELIDSPTSLEILRSHTDALKNIYGDLLVFNLVDKKGHELIVGNAMTKYFTKLNDNRIKYTHFDFHHECRKLQWHRVRNLLVEFESELVDQKYTLIKNGIVVQRQTSVVRTNCMDCLDRTNVVQSEIARFVLTNQFKRHGLFPEGQTIADYPEFDKVFKNMWADNADALSMHYSGTGALKTDFTRTGKRSLSGTVQDGVNSLLRYVKNNYLDGSRQDAMDLLQGRYEISPLKPVVTVYRTARFYTLIGLFALAFVSIVTVLTFRMGGDSLVLYVLFWSAILALVIQLILQYGEEFVALPSLINPYQDFSSGKYVQVVLNNSSTGSAIDQKLK